MHILKAVLIELGHAILFTDSIFATTICRLVLKQIKDIIKLFVEVYFSDGVGVVGAGGLLINISLGHGSLIFIACHSIRVEIASRLQVINILVIRVVCIGNAFEAATGRPRWSTIALRFLGVVWLTSVVGFELLSEILELLAVFRTLLVGCAHVAFGAKPRVTI